MECEVYKISWEFASQYGDQHYILYILKVNFSLSISLLPSPDYSPAPPPPPFLQAPQSQHVQPKKEANNEFVKDTSKKRNKERLPENNKMNIKR